MTTEKHEFQTETRRLLDLMIHSLYSNKDIFLRELVSNASDALDKRRFAAVTQPDLLGDEELEIRLTVDPEARTLAIADNGIGMTRDEVVANIGTIAKSGTRELVEALKRTEEAQRPDLIGQFGVGFYSSFLVADRVVLVTRKAGEAAATRWESSGDGTYEVGDAERDRAGTTVTLHLKAADADDGIQDYTSDWILEQLVRKYSDFVGYPIRLQPPGKDEPKTLNSMKAIWTRSAAEVTDDEYKEFYKHISHDWNDPLTHFSTSIEGTFEARALLYVPGKAPWDVYQRDRVRRGVQLYVKRVFIMDDCEALLPSYLRFVKGVVDAEDLPLNVSREILQENRQIKAIRKHLVKKTVDALLKLQSDHASDYRAFWSELGPVVKEGLIFGPDRNDKVLDLVLAASTHDPDAPTTLADYVERMKEGQDTIYYMTAASIEAARSSPHLEAFRDRGVEVLLFADPVDDIWLSQAPAYKDKTWQSVGQGEVEVGSDEEKKAAKEAREARKAELGDLLLALRAALQEQVKEVRLSSRLTSSAACLVTDEGDLTPQMERLMKATGQAVPRTKRILEVNPGHPVVEKLSKRFAASSSDPVIGEYARLLYGQAVLAEGGELDDPGAFARLVADVMVRAG